jgi:DNA phosphorothioation-dependent restriction protein DptG
MSRIIEKKSRRYRTQFSMSKPLWEKFQEVNSLAAESNKTIHLTEDFEKWFSKLIEQLRDELAKEKAKQEAGECSNATA